MHELVLVSAEMGDDVESYRTRAVRNPTTGRWVHALQQRPDGSCVYLEAGRCSIHGRAPNICKVFDCRGVALMGTRAERRRKEKTIGGYAAIVARGRELLEGKP
jgi:uncharacterized protein